MLLAFVVILNTLRGKYSPLKYESNFQLKESYFTSTVAPAASKFLFDACGFCLLMFLSLSWCAFNHILGFFSNQDW